MKAWAVLCIAFFSTAVFAKTPTYDISIDNQSGSTLTFAASTGSADKSAIGPGYVLVKLTGNAATFKILLTTSQGNITEIAFPGGVSNLRGCNAKNGGVCPYIEQYTESKGCLTNADKSCALSFKVANAAASSQPASWFNAGIFFYPY